MRKEANRLIVLWIAAIVGSVAAIASAVLFIVFLFNDKQKAYYFILGIQISILLIMKPLKLLYKLKFGDEL